MGKELIAAFVLSALATLAFVVLAFGQPDTVTLRTDRDSHLVQSGDTLWIIARSNFNGDTRAAVDRIRAINELETAILLPGQVLKLR